MQSFIGIYDTSYDYAVSLTEYVNRRRDFGFNAVAFKNTSEIKQFLTSNKLSYLLINNQIHLNKYNTEKIFFLCEEKSDLNLNTGKNCIFKYQKAQDILKSILPVRENTKKSSIDVVFSFDAPGSAIDYVCADTRRKDAECTKQMNVANIKQPEMRQAKRQTNTAPSIRYVAIPSAMSAAVSNARPAGVSPKTLVIIWDPFWGAVGEISHINLSDTLFMYSGNTESLKKTLNSSGDNSLTVMSGVNYYSDIWDFSPADTEQFVKICMNYGNFDRVIIVCTFLSPGTEKLMELSDTVTLVGGNSETHENFKNQMKYAGKNGILMKLKTEDSQ